MNGQRGFVVVVTFAVLMFGHSVSAFDSGSDESDGAYEPDPNVPQAELVMPPDGIFNFTTVEIPTGVTVTVRKNTGNTPLIILASGDVNIAGTLRVNGGDGLDVGNVPTVTDGTPGIGGPGGGDGGRGGIFLTTGNLRGGEGRGLGAGRPGAYRQAGVQGCGGGGGGFGSPGGSAPFVDCRFAGATGGRVYGASTLSQILGGSGGGGGSGGFSSFGSGGGGGGGALLIASSTTIDITGEISANGGRGGGQTLTEGAGAGGGGSGGAIRIVASTITGEGAISAIGGLTGATPTCGVCPGGAGGFGRVRLEAENFVRLAPTTPNYTFSAPRPIFLSGFPTLSITSVGGIAAPAVPTGDRDIILPGLTSNPVTVELATTGVPANTPIELLAKPTLGIQTSASTVVDASGLASASIDLPNGASVLIANLTFTVTVAMGNALKNFAQGEQVERVELAAAPGRGSTTTLITVSGKRYTLPSNAVVLN